MTRAIIIVQALAIALLLARAYAERAERRETQVRLDHVSSWFLAKCYATYSHSECNELWAAAQSGV